MNEHAAFLAEFHAETDRAAAVLGAAYLDARLEELLRSKFVAVPKFVDDLFQGQGGLSNFSSRISVSYAVGLISLPVAEDLHLVRRIRNDFAHHVHGLTFQTDSIAQRTAAFRILTAVHEQDGKPLPPPDQSRIRFDFAVSLLLFMGLEARIRDMPQFAEAKTSGLITLERF